MTTVTLTPEQETFAAQAVAEGRFRDVGEVVGASLVLLQRAEAERAAFIASLEAAQAAGERDGFATLDDVEREMDEIIEAAERRRA
ncbi:type II toxin-antitoxin system ParD family antitoxin [Roseomonas mucosa]|uniref:ribbon-helix-helix domain-containing protein n=1 Tax=Roseomonas mucosa TaxID=207340 RepID=UPI0028CFC3C9|nr:type II toxin-antitoxin system ParD family antitoxin [Roseomonas mucosa]MDT8278645.1 type II toxin-antitoxin system ParD family antitoxin [Roseomonas mucosa]